MTLSAAELIFVAVLARSAVLEPRNWFTKSVNPADIALFDLFPEEPLDDADGLACVLLLRIDVSRLFRFCAAVAPPLLAVEAVDELAEPDCVADAWALGALPPVAAGVLLWPTGGTDTARFAEAATGRAAAVTEAVTVTAAAAPGEGGAMPTAVATVAEPRAAFTSDDPAA
ncbi:hypothetical protein [Methylobacterium gregans]|uniref:hypothetical protein n=1 Tax=Methylobacterium gregans TaxID=374424 RepID=UPI001EE38C34|nr:hypothetical protein [Methylobacterium gregans]MDQ0522030.1 hypothetical protein [Methylobacterium gregans]